MLDRAPRVGGRIGDREIGGLRVETGATLFHSSNRLIVAHAQRLGLETIDLSARPQTFGIWQGKAFAIRTSGSGLIDRLRLLARYRRSLLRASRLVREMVSRFEAVYDLLEAGAVWDSPAALLAELDLAELRRERALDAFRPRRLSARFVEEFADSVSRNNYGQHADTLSAFVDLVSLAGAGLGGGRLLRVRDGNRLVCEGLISEAQAQLHNNTLVTAIRRRPKGFEVVVAGSPSMEADSVVLAAPLELAGITLDGVAVDIPPRKYKTIHATFVVGRIRTGSFGTGPVPDFVLTTREVGSLLSLQRLGTTAAGDPIYKAFSLEPLTDAAVEALLEPSEVARITWQAYPELAPSPRWASFRLADGLYYPSAMEHAVSTMETQALAGAAAANLLAADAGLLPARS